MQALCLGAKGVGLGRPILYANSAYGEEGVIRAVSGGWHHLTHIANPFTKALLLGSLLSQL